MFRVAFDIGKPKDIIDYTIVCFSSSCCTHCELVFSNNEAYSSDPKSGGTRYKNIDFTDTAKWKIIDLPWIDAVAEQEIRKFCDLELGCAYDWRYVFLGCLFNISNSPTKWFCTEVAMEAIRPYCKRGTTNWLTPAAMMGLMQREYDIYVSLQKTE